jgi:hypothetical protein
MATMTETSPDQTAADPLDVAVRELERLELDMAPQDDARPLARWSEAGMTVARRLIDTALREMQGARVVRAMHDDTQPPADGPLSVLDMANEGLTFTEHLEATCKRLARREVAEQRALLVLATWEIQDVVDDLEHLTPDGRMEAWRILTRAMSELVAVGLVDDLDGRKVSA